MKRYGNRRKFNRKRKGAIKTRRVATGKASTNIVKLQKQVSTIRKSLRQKAVTCQYVHGQNQFNVASDFTQFNLMQYASWAPCFGASVVDGTDNKAYLKNTMVECRLSIENFSSPSELDTVDYTAFLVSLRDEASNVWNQTNGTLTLSAGRDYTNGTVEGMMIRLNPKMFKIHRMKRITTTNFGAVLTYSSAAGSMKPIVKWTWKVSPRRPITNPIGDWSAMAIDRDPSKNLYVLLFNNNSTLDGTSPQFSVYGLHTVQVQGA